MQRVPPTNFVSHQPPNGGKVTVWVLATHWSQLKIEKMFVVGGGGVFSLIIELFLLHHFAIYWSKLSWAVPKEAPRVDMEGH